MGTTQDLQALVECRNALAELPSVLPIPMPEKQSIRRYIAVNPRLRRAGHLLEIPRFHVGMDGRETNKLGKRRHSMWPGTRFPST